jgi:hypothetical protein
LTGEYLTLTSFRLLQTGLVLFDDICSYLKKNMKILKDDENNNTVVIYLTEIFVLLVKLTSRQDFASTKRLKNDSFDYVDFTVDYESPPEDFGDKTHEKQYSSPRAMKSDSQTKVKLKHQDIDAPKKEATPEWVINLMSSVKQLEQKADNTMDEVDALKKKETAKQELQTVIKSEKSEDENNVDLTEN